MNKFVSNYIFEEVSFKDDLSIVVVTHKRIDFLKTLTKTLAAAIEKKTGIKPHVIICVNGPDEVSKSFIESNETFSQLNAEKIYLKSPVTPAEARNIACQSVNSDWIFFLDDDVEVPENLFMNFESLKKNDPEVSLWGGPNLTPQSSSSIQQKVGWFLENYLVTGPISYRYKLNQLQEREAGEFYFSLCNMFVKTKYFKNIGFNTRLKTAEENELIFNFSKNNLKMKTSDSLYVWHCRRNSIPHFLSQVQNYGYGRGQLIYNGTASGLIPLFLFSALALFLFMLIKMPILLLSIFLFWHGAIFMKLLFDFDFQFKNISDIFIPMRLWTNYFIGMLNGYLRSFKINPASKRR